MHRKFDIRRYLTAFFVGIFAVVGTVVAIDAPANAAIPSDVASSPVDSYASLNGTNQGFGRTGVSFGAHGSNFTVEMWLNPSSISGSRMLYGKQDSFAMTLVNGVVTCQMKGTAGGSWLAAVSADKALVVDQWQHIAFVKAGNVAKLYLNGQMVWTVTDAGKLPAAGLLDNTTYVGIGASNYDGSANQSVPAGSYFSGGMDEVKIWNSARTQTQIETGMHSKLATPATDLLAYWDFNGSISPLYDYSANGLDLTAANAPVITDVKTTTKVSGKTVLTFPRSYLTNTGGWTVPAGVTRADALAIGGGGGGASRHAGGGGAGEVGSFSGLSLTPAGVLRIKVGAGGAGFDSTTNNTNSSGQNGQSTILGPDEFLGGGGGQGGTGVVGSGGSGGGTAGSTNAGGPGVNGTGTTSSPTLTRYASAGGAGNTSGTAWFGGGGGGATGAGTAASTSAAGAGGQGFSSSITGVAKCYAAGGGGGSTNSNVGAAGTCANGATTTATPGTFNTAAAAASANSGSGGGAGGLNGSDDQPSGAGGSGIVIIAYALSLDDTAWDFASSADNKYVATSKQLIPSKVSFTFEGWVKADTLSATSWNCIFRQQSTSSNYLAFEVGVYQKRIQVIDSIQSSGPNTFNTHSASDSRTLLTTGQWYHIAVASQFTVSGANSINDLKVFLDGAEVYSASKTIATTSLENLGNAGLSFGGLYSAADRGWDGQLDQFKVWNGALTQAEILKSMHTYDATGVVSTSGASLRALYDFNSTSTSTLVDQTGNGYDFAPTAGAATPVVRNVRDTAVTGSTTSYTFTRSYLNAWGGWIPEVTSTAVKVLAIGGGGGGAENVGAGGSGGGISYSTGKTISPAVALPVTVGQGGAGGSYYLNNASDTSTATLLRDGSNGQDSKVSFSTAMVGTGGVGGQTYWLDNKCAGTGNNNVDTTGLAGTGGSANAAGGTGGKGAAGSGNGFAGSSGYSTSIRGTSETFAGGGGGGSFGGAGALGGAGGTGGGGAGAATSGSAGVAGTANTGGGGGGGSVQCGAGANGAAGLVVFAVVATVGNPTISGQPASVSKAIGQTANFTVTATSPDSGTLSYQWQVSTDSGSTWSNVSSGSGGTTNSYTTAAVATGDSGNKYRVQITNTVSADTATVNSDPATLIVNLAAVNVQFDELNFDFANVLHVVGTNGKALNDKVLFRNVTTKGGVQVDALVTTKTLSGATIANYESGTGAGGANSYFQVDAAITAANGYAEFQFDFYQHGVSGTAGDPCKTNNTTCTGSTKVKLQNVNVSAIDIDYLQWNDFTAVESYTMAANGYTKLFECLIPGSGTCTSRVAPTTFPANMRFQGSGDSSRTNDPVDMAIVSYAQIETFKIKFGRSSANNTNYYGVAFKALSWGVHTPASVGGTSYTISYNGNGSTVGNVPTSNTGVVGANITLPGAGTLTKTGYTFAGWNTAADGTGTTYSAANVIQMPQGGMTLYAKWTANQYMLIYKLYGGVSGPATEMRSTGAVANLSATQPTRDGAVFLSWNTTADGNGTTYAPSASFTMPGANTTLHAIWGVATGTLAYDANGGSSAPTGGTGTSGTTTTAATVGSMTRTNYTFSGWNTAANGSGTDYTVGASVTYPGNGLTTTLYAQWTPVLYSYTYNANGGTGAPAGGSTTAGATVNIPSSTTTRTGYTFAGWTTAADGTGTVYTNGSGNTSFTMPGANAVLYAKWTAITYTLTFDVNTGSGGPSPLTGTYGTNLTVAAAPTAPANKKFNGWNTAADGSGATYAVTGTYQITADATLYAQWIIDTVNLFYSANGGTGAPTSTTASANQNTILSGTAPTRTGFTFSGWTTASNGTGTVYGISSTFPVPGSDTTLYAKWTPIGYNFIYDANGGSGAPSTVAYFMGEFVVIDNGGSALRTGYTFAGWNTQANGGGSDYVGGQNFLMSNSNMTMYAKWTSNPYTLTYNGNTGTGVPIPETRNAGAVANLSATTPTKTGYTFNGWNTAQNGTGANYNASASFTMPTTNATLYAQWNANSNAVAYNANNGTGAPTGANHSYGSTVTVSSTAPTRTGYTFLGWNTAADGSGTNYSAADTFAMPNASVTLYARWSILQKTFTYDANGGAGVDVAATYNYGATVTVSSNQPTRAGYSFIGWNSMADGTGTARAAASTFTMPDTDLTVYAMWSINAYTVYYNMNGGTGSISPQPGTYGTNITVSSTLPTRIGYTFSGWNTQADGSGSDQTGGGTLTIPASNLTLYAKWTAIQYSISYNANGGSGSPADATGLTAGTNATLSSTAPVQSGFVFNGWNTAANGTGQTYAGGQSYIVPAANTVLYAQWVANTYEVIYNANGGTGAPAAENGATSATVSLSATQPTRPGYSFVRWNSDVTDATSGTRYAPGGSFVVPAGNTVLYAIWALADITVTYDINNGSGTTPSTVTDKYLATVTLAPSTSFSRSGYTFNGWNTLANGTGSSYAAESNFVLPDANLTLYAQWSQVFYAVEYNSNGGANAPANQFAAPGSTVSIPPTEPTKAGFDFDDWTSAGAGTTLTPGDTLTMPSSNVVLVANWVTRSSVPTGGTNSGPIASPSPSPTPSVTSPAPKKLSETVYFKGDSAVLLPAAKAKLKAVAKKAITNGVAAKIQVIGRVKETNDKSYDARLSRQRATNVASYLRGLGVKGVWVITAAGISPENKAISRRVDLYINWK